MARSFLNQTGVEPGLHTDRILTMRMFFATARYWEDGRRGRFMEDILVRVRTHSRAWRPPAPRISCR